jgi:hypothetical protein
MGGGKNTVQVVRHRADNCIFQGNMSEDGTQSPAKFLIKKTLVRRQWYK